MRTSFALLSCVLFPLLGCDKTGEATGQSGTKPGFPRAAQTTPASAVPISSASTPSPKALVRAVEVEVEEIDDQADVAARARPGFKFFAVRVRVESLREERRPRLDPNRFLIETAQGEQFAPRRSGRLEPVLPTVYLKKGTSASGWLTFEIPAASEGLVLKSDLTIPALQIPVAGGT